MYMNLGITHTMYLILPHSQYVTLSKLLNLFEPQFLGLKGDDNADFHVKVRGAWRLPYRSNT